MRKRRVSQPGAFFDGSGRNNSRRSYTPFFHNEIQLKCGDEAARQVNRKIVIRCASLILHQTCVATIRGALFLLPRL